MRPLLSGMADALLVTDPRFPWIGPTPEEKDVAGVLIEMDQIHHPDRLDADNPDDDPLARTYGFCLGCAEQWPCGAWLSQQAEGISWLTRAAGRVHAHARGPLDPVIRAMRHDAGHVDDTRRDPGGRVLSGPRTPCNVEIPPHRD